MKIYCIILQKARKGIEIGKRNLGFGIIINHESTRISANGYKYLVLSRQVSDFVLENRVWGLWVRV